MINSQTSTIVVRGALPNEIERWDELVGRFPESRVTHTRAWLESLLASGCGKPTYLIVESEGHMVGLLAGLQKRIGPLRMFGSPPPGTQSVGMGPLMSREQISEAEFISATTNFLERKLGIHYIEWMCDGLSRATMESLGYKGAPVVTYRMPLSPHAPQAVFRGMKESARRNCRRAEKLGLVVRWEQDTRFVDEAYDQMQEVFGRRGNTVSFDKCRVTHFFNYMRDANRLLAIGIYLPEDGPCIATGLFTHYRGELLLWQWTHRTEHRWYRPTEFMTWSAMRRAMEAGCDSFDLMGGGDFKAKFGATLDENKMRWSRGRYRWLNGARDLAERCYRWRQSFRAGHNTDVEKTERTKRTPKTKQTKERERSMVS